jgi:hypothetical protein
MTYDWAGHPGASYFHFEIPRKLNWTFSSGNSKIYRTVVNHVIFTSTSTYKPILFMAAY